MIGSPLTLGIILLILVLLLTIIALRTFHKSGLARSRLVLSWITVYSLIPSGILAIIFSLFQVTGCNTTQLGLHGHPGAWLFRIPFPGFGVDIGWAGMSPFELLASAALIGLTVISLILFLNLTISWWYHGFLRQQRIPNSDIFAALELRMPEVEIILIASAVPEAYAAAHPGLSRNNKSYVVITSALVETLEWDEIEAICWHELGHVIHGDTIYLSLFCRMKRLLPLDPVIRSLSNWSVRDSEFLADSFSIERTSDPNALASALKKLSSHYTRGEARSSEPAIIGARLQRMRDMGLPAARNTGEFQIP